MSKNSINHGAVIVGIGASAGGLEAFQQLITGLPDDHDMVLILVQHLDPDHESMMPELVSAKTSSPVHSIKDGMKVERGCVYLSPPGHELEIEDDVLRLVPFDEPRGLRRPIDRFFKALARERGEQAIAVVLSGTGSDGAIGAREVKGAGGLVFVQDPKQAKYDGMPQSVLDLSGADIVSGAEEIIDVVRDYFNLRQGAKDGLDEDGEFISRIIRHVRFRTGHDFSEYKIATMQRRIAVRMSVLNINSPNDYLTHMVETKTEAELLFRDLLINVTSFFRDTDHFDTLAEEVIPELVKATEEHGELRIWVAGCSTGEEAYSIGILVAEEIARVKKTCNVVIFGTDIDEQALQTARTGRYPDAITETVPAALIGAYFKATKDGYEVGGQLREMVRFSRHSFIKDPPFSKIDMVSCRNVLIYLKNSLQDLTGRVFHYALREGGYLFLGPSENPKNINDFFVEHFARERIFTRRPGVAKPLNLGRLSGAVLNRPPPKADTTTDTGAFSDAQKVLLEEFVPAYLHVDAQRNVLYSSPEASAYLKLRGGKMSTELFDIVPTELEPTFRRVSRIEQQAGSKAEFEYQGSLNGAQVRLVVTARRLVDGSQLFVIRDNLQLLESRPSSSNDLGEKQDAYVSQLEVELDDAKQAVRTTVEELETSNEELKSSNEEMMSMNEELQSANEELTTINDELQEKLRSLNQANVDMRNFVQSARIPTVFLDEELRLLRYTPETEAFFSFAKGDIGRAIVDLNSELDQDRLIELCAQTVKDSTERTEEFRTNNGKVNLSVRIMPYSPDGQDARGVVFTLQDITKLRRAIETADSAKAQAEVQMEEVEQIYDTSPMAMGLISRDMKYLRLNDKLAEMNGPPVAHHIGKTIREIIPTVADHTEALVAKVLETGNPVVNEIVRGTTLSEPDRERVWQSDWIPYYANGNLAGVSVMVRDITEHTETADNLRHIMRELEHRVKNMLSNVNALINRASREATVDGPVFETLTKRIQGLSKTHSLLTAEQWSSAALRQVIEPETVDVYGEDRVTLAGPDIRVVSEATLALGMAIHELATNAAKYGAFSHADGRVHVKWSRINDAQSDRLVIEWSETGGPPVEKPEGTGFGSKLIQSTIEGSLDGNVSHFWEPNGLRVVIELDFNETTAP